MQSGRPAGSDQANQSTDDEYEMRRARTPIPTFVADAVKRHLGKIYTREVKREGPPDLEQWWKDVDGRGTSIDCWMSLTVAPLLMVLGQLDVMIEPPPVPEGETVKSRADEMRLKLDQLQGNYILPENVPWWRCRRDGTYAEIVIREVQDDASIEYRYWNDEVWALYRISGDRRDAQGKIISVDSSMVDEPVEHGYGRVPVIRLFDRHRPRYRFVGLPRYEPLAEIQREYYNRDSEMILSDTIQAHPLLQGPDDYVTPDGMVPIGPGWLLPKKKNQSGSSVSYEGFDYIEPPKGGAESIRQNKADLRDAADRASLLTKPVGAHGTSQGTVEQSGVAKRLDNSEGNDLLAEIAETLSKAEHSIASLFLEVAHREPPDPEACQITYPRQFSLLSLDELLKAILDYQAVRDGSGITPEIDGALMKQSVRLMIQGLKDDEYEVFDDEIDEFVQAASKDHELARENAALAEPAEVMPGETPPAEEPPPEQAPDQMTQPMKEAKQETA